MATSEIPTKVKDVVITNPLDGFRLSISWSANPSQEELTGYNIYKGYNVGMAFDKINTTLVNQLQYIDINAGYDFARKDLWYRINAVNANGEGPMSEAVRFVYQDAGRIDFIITEMKRRHSFIMTNDGMEARLWFRKRAGTRCSCWDSSMASPRDRCPECFGVGYVGGYDKYASSEFRFVLVPAKERVTYTTGGIIVDRLPVGWCLSVPIITSGDVIVTMDNKRFFVQDVTPQINRGIITWQEFVVREVEPTNIVYALGNTGAGKIPAGLAGAYYTYKNLYRFLDPSLTSEYPIRGMRAVNR